MNQSVLAVVGTMAIATGAARSCCISYDDIAVTLANETAVIIWDAQKKIEHFVRRSEFVGGAPDFGFIFPSPTQPFRIEVADEELFTLLERQRPARTLDDPVKSEAASMPGSIEILEQKVVGDYEVTVIRGTDGASINDWLVKHGHKMRPSMTPWFEYYAQRGWVFTAFKYQGRGSETPTKAVCISFEAERPHYPYKMPSDTWEPDHFRPLSLFVISQSDLSGEYIDGTPWQAKKEWSVELNNRTIERIEVLLTNGKEKVALPANLVLTRFRNVPQATDYSQDLTFVEGPRAAAQILGPGSKPWLIAGAGALLIVLIAIRLMRNWANPIQTKE
jgi:hypothetical protein